MPNRGRNPREPPPPRRGPSPPPPEKEWMDVMVDLKRQGNDWEEVILKSLWRHLTEEVRGVPHDPTPGSTIEILWNQEGHPTSSLGPKATSPPPDTLGFSPITTIHAVPVEPTPEASSFSPIHTVHSAKTTPELTSEPTQPSTKRKGKTLTKTRQLRPQASTKQQGGKKDRSVQN
ncbi:hypothetical protein BDZ91DRAFT_801618 [Kalaharituber pfeilii]|nr:hypothetical protein BDZ91DRAFT_801618 [Kalaharituber pfeilii]